MIKVNIPQINFNPQVIPTTLTEGEKKDLRRIVNAVSIGKLPRISQQRLINLKRLLAK